ncbi:MAG: hypothetical protein HFE77_03560 [Clostridiales bacterium]|nr:hypothetical protein [Clostridiales bacterium]
MKKINWTHILIPLLAAGIGISIGQLCLTRFGAYIDGTNQLTASFWPGFMNSFFITLAPIVGVIFLSITVYGTPASLLALIFETAQDTYFILSASAFITKTGSSAILPCAFLIASRAFLSYCYLLLAVRTLAYRTQTKKQANGLETVFSQTSRCFYRDFTSVAGLMCLGGLLTHTILYFS